MNGERSARRATVLQALAGASGHVDVAEQLRLLASHPEFELPLPGAGRTVERWQILSEVAAHDLSVVKLFEGHADALAILRELEHEAPGAGGATWGTWAAESPGGRVLMSGPQDSQSGGRHEKRVRLNGIKHWCSGAGAISHALLTTWKADGSGPYLAAVALDQPGVSIDAGAWHAVGMADSSSLEVRFDGALAEPVGARGDYVSRPGFMHGGAGIAACWWGGAVALAGALHRAVASVAEPANLPFRVAALGKVDTALAQTAALLRETAAWVDRWPRADPSVPTLRVRQSAEACARTVLDEVGRALGATPFCRDRPFARMAADLAVFTRQSLAERDFQALGHRVASTAPRWRLDSEP